MHALIVGPRQVGKSTLIKKVMDSLNVECSGFYTKKEDSLRDGELGSPLYIYSVGGEITRSVNNLLAHCQKGRPRIYRQAFDAYAGTVAALSGSGGLIVMDELGFMEACSPDFCAAVEGLLHGDTPVLAAVKPDNTPFLNRVRGASGCRCFYITEDNRDGLFYEVLDFVKKQLDIS